MYNAAPPYAGGQQSPYGIAGSPGMAGGGMMHGGGNGSGSGSGNGNGNGNGMAQMGMNGPSYQTPYASSPYGNNQSPAGIPPNFTSSNPSMNSSSFPMNNPNMMHQQQHPSLRMHPSSTPTQNNGPRAPLHGVQNSPINISQPQFATPQSTNNPMLQTSNQLQQHAAANMILTPQTPTFPGGAQGPAGGSIATPLSPGSEAIEKERVTLLLEINLELLMEVMRLQAVQAEAKKDDAAAATEGPVEKNRAEKERAEKSKAASGRDYLECMRRLQGNLAYLAAIADRSHKPSSQIPSHPAIMTAPPLSGPSPSHPTSTTSKKEDSSPTAADKSPPLEDPHRADSLREQYTRLQSLFPGVDPRKEPPTQAANAQAARAKQQMMQQQQQQQHMNQNQEGGQQGGGQQGNPAALDPNHAQKVQNDMLRQKMMQQQQAQQQQAQQQMQAQINAQMQAQFQMHGR